MYQILKINLLKINIKLFYLFHEYNVSVCFKNIVHTFAEERSSNEEDKSQNISNYICQNDMVDSALPAPDNRQQRIAEFQKLKANCKPEELQKIKTRCEILVRECIAGLLIQLSTKDFKEVEGEFSLKYLK